MPRMKTGPSKAVASSISMKRGRHASISFPVWKGNLKSPHPTVSSSCTSFSFATYSCGGSSTVVPPIER